MCHSKNRWVKVSEYMGCEARMCSVIFVWKVYVVTVREMKARVGNVGVEIKIEVEYYTVCR